MSAPTYELVAIADLLRVPAHRREACIRDILYCLALRELAFGESAVEVNVGPISWTDDGNPSASIHELGGACVLTLAVKPA